MAETSSFFISATEMEKNTEEVIKAKEKFTEAEFEGALSSIFLQIRKSSNKGKFSHTFSGSSRWFDPFQSRKQTPDHKTALWEALHDALTVRGYSVFLTLKDCASTVVCWTKR